MKTRGRTAPFITLTVLALFAAPSPASSGAAKATAECPQNSLCVWSKANYEGDRLVIDRLGASNKIFKKMDDRVSSARLRYPGGAAQLYEDKNGEGDTLCLLDAPGLKKYPDLSKTGGGYDNIMSSSYLSAEPFGTCF
jgi:hypothetical protein